VTRRLARHVVPAVAAAALLAGAAVGLDGLGRFSAEEGAVWVLGVDAVDLMRGLPADGDTRIVDAWWGGRVVRLHVASLRETAHWRAPRAVMLRLPVAALGWSPCG
jgi:hypothetical protein